MLNELLGDFEKHKILDLGCGDGRFGVEALEKDVKEYVGVEGSEKMVRLARDNLAGTSAVIYHRLIEDWEFPTEAFDLVISRLVFHYIESITPVFEQIYKTLIPGGRLIFSVEHPVITCCNLARQEGERRQSWIVDDYFNSGKRQTRWNGKEVIKFHRTIEEYFMALRSVGFVIDAVRESKPQPEVFGSDKATYSRRMRIPLFLFFSAIKPG